MSLCTRIVLTGENMRVMRRACLVDEPLAQRLVFLGENRDPRSEGQATGWERKVDQVLVVDLSRPAYMIVT
jgi:hypothetical protein